MINATGRRKTAVARVFVQEGSGRITVNKRDVNEYFTTTTLQYTVRQPLEITQTGDKFDLNVNLDGGGSTAMVVNNTIVNSPSDSAGERAVANVLLVVKRKQ